VHITFPLSSLFTLQIAALPWPLLISLRIRLALLSGLPSSLDQRRIWFWWSLLKRCGLAVLVLATCTSTTMQGHRHAARLPGAVVQFENFELPSATTTATAVLVSYFVITAGIAYDVGTSGAAPPTPRSSVGAMVVDRTALCSAHASMLSPASPWSC
jgi:hypothetical protein